MQNVVVTPSALTSGMPTLVEGATYGAKRVVLIQGVSSVLNDLRALMASIGMTHTTHEKCNRQFLDRRFTSLFGDILV